jgi:hypothetical protein
MNSKYYKQLLSDPVITGLSPVIYFMMWYAQTIYLFPIHRSDPAGTK